MSAERGPSRGSTVVRSRGSSESRASFSPVRSISRAETRSNTFNRPSLRNLSEFKPTAQTTTPERSAQSVGPDIFQKTVPFVPTSSSSFEQPTFAVIDLSPSFSQKVSEDKSTSSSSSETPRRTLDWKNMVDYAPKVEAVNLQLSKPISLGKTDSIAESRIIIKDLPSSEPKVSLVKQPKQNEVGGQSDAQRIVENSTAPVAEKVNLLKTPVVQETNSIADLREPVSLIKADLTSETKTILDTSAQSSEPKVSLVKQPKESQIETKEFKLVAPQTVEQPIVLT